MYLYKIKLRGGSEIYINSDISDLSELIVSVRNHFQSEVYFAEYIDMPTTINKK